METRNIVQVAEELLRETEEKKEAISAFDFKMVTFSLCDKDYAIDIMHVKEIAKAGRFTYVPNTLPFVLGVYNLRGEIIPILDLRIFFNIDVPERDENKLENLLILNIDDQKFGLVVDKIDKVVGVHKSSIQPPHPLFADINIKYINGVVESNNRLYVLLDVIRIFALRDEAEKQTPKQFVEPQQNIQANIPQPSAKPTEVLPKKEDTSELDLKFIAETLAEFKNFHVSEVNNVWLKHRYTEWQKERGNDVQLKNEADASEFLKAFWSKHSEKWWSKEYAQAITNMLPENSAKQIVVWNPGCGQGFEAYSLACILKQKYPTAKVRIYAHDIDLLAVSNATMINVPDDVASDWYAPFVTQKANGEYTFKQDIKDCIMFEYHNCKNSNTLPMVDLIFARDTLSFLDEASQKNVISDFMEKMKGNAIAIIGENEAMPLSFNFREQNQGTLYAYSKD